MTRKVGLGLNLLDGPAIGTYMCQRAPVYLRAVVGTDGKADVLDQWEDTPEPTERTDAEPGLADDPPNDH